MCSSSRRSGSPLEEIFVSGIETRVGKMVALAILTGEIIATERRQDLQAQDADDGYEETDGEHEKE